MDLQIILQKVNDHQYLSLEEYIDDIRLIKTHAEIVHGKDTDIAAKVGDRFSVLVLCDHFFLVESKSRITINVTISYSMFVGPWSCGRSRIVGSLPESGPYRRAQDYRATTTCRDRSDEQEEGQREGEGTFSAA